MRSLVLFAMLAACGHPHGAAGGDARGGDDDDGGGSGSGDGGMHGDGGTGGDDGGGGGDGGGGMHDSGMHDGGGTDACGLAVCAQAFSGGTKGAALAAAVDAQNNVYIAGLSENDLVFGTHTLFQQSARDAFVVSFAADGTFRWAKRWGQGTYLAGAYGIAVDAASNIYIVGGSTGTIDFGGGPIGGPIGSFVASFDTNGNYRWARRDAGSGFLGVAMSAGQVYAIGRFAHTVTYAPGISVTAAGTDGDEDVVVATFDAATGNAVWARAFGEPFSDNNGGITAHADWIAFTMSSGAVGSGERMTSLTTAGADRWSVPLPAAWDLRGIITDPTGNLYISGLHDWGQDVLPGAPTENGNNEYVHAYADGGASRWSWTLTESPAYHWTAIPYTPSAWDPAGHLVLAGTYMNALYAGGPALPQDVEAIFVATFATDSTPLGAHRVDDHSTSAHEFVTGLAIDGAGTTWIVGEYWGTPNFGDGALPFSSEGGVLIVRTH